MILFTGEGLPQCMLGCHPPPRPGTLPSGAGNPLGVGTPLPVQSMLGDMVNAQAVRILLKCNLVLCIYCSNKGQNDQICALFIIELA